MPQSPSPWKRAALAIVAGVERGFRGKQVHAHDLREIRSFLVLQYESPLGSVVHATPLFEALKTAVPNAAVVVATSAMAESVLGNNPFIDRCVTTPSPFVYFSRATASVRELLRGLPEEPRCIVTAIGNQRTRIAMLALAAGKAARVGYTLAPQLYDVSLPFNPVRGQSQGNLDIVRALGHTVGSFRPRIFFRPSDVLYASEMLRSDADASASRIAFVTQNSGGQRNRWSSERFVEVIAALCQGVRRFPVFLGTAADVQPIEAIRSRVSNPGVSLAGKTTVPQLAAVLSQCDLIVSLDTGTFHVARAVGLPGVVLAPAWQDPREWLPVGEARYRVLRGPSMATAPPDYCMEEIEPEQVIAAGRELLESYPPNADGRATRLEASLRNAQ